MDNRWQRGVIWDLGNGLWGGVEVTVTLAWWALLIGLALGLLLGLMRSSRLVVLRWPAAVYVDIFRATPILLQLVWIYYALPILLGLQMGNMVAASVGSGLHAAAYIAEIFRAGIDSIDRGQSDAAESLGIGYGQALRRILPPR